MFEWIFLFLKKKHHHHMGVLTGTDWVCRPRAHVFMCVCMHVHVCVLGEERVWTS